MCSSDERHPGKPPETGSPTSNYPGSFFRAPVTWLGWTPRQKITNLLFDTTGLPQLWGFMAVFHKPCCNSTWDIYLNVDDYHVDDNPVLVDELDDDQIQQGKWSNIMNAFTLSPKLTKTCKFRTKDPNVNEMGPNRKSLLEIIGS